MQRNDNILAFEFMKPKETENIGTQDNQEASCLELDVIAFSFIEMPPSKTS